MSVVANYIRLAVIGSPSRGTWWQPRFDGLAPRTLGRCLLSICDDPRRTNAPRYGSSDAQVIEHLRFTRFSYVIIKEARVLRRELNGGGR